MNEYIERPLISMLMSFRGSNFRSLRDEFELSLQASPISKQSVARKIPWRLARTSKSINEIESFNSGNSDEKLEHFQEIDEASYIELLPVAGIFGPNASGKSNVLQAMNFMRWMVLNSFVSNLPNGQLPQMPFHLDTHSRLNGTRFEIDLILEGVRHVYGFEFNSVSIVEEWAYRYPHGRPSRIFHRSEAKIEFGTSVKAKGRIVEGLLRPNALFLSTAVQANFDPLKSLFNWFEKNLDLAAEATRGPRTRVSIEMLKNLEFRSKVLSLLTAADLGITGAFEREVDPSIREAAEKLFTTMLRQQSEASIDDAQPKMSVEILNLALTHRRTGGDDVEFTLNDESAGTLVWLGLVGPVVKALAEGTVLLADELDASLHPALVIELIELFQSPKTNPNFAQLIFNSHDPTMLGDSAANRLLGLDQIWFTEKFTSGKSHLYPLTDLNPRREGEAISKRYLAGLYGATPILSRAEFEIAVGNQSENV